MSQGADTPCMRDADFLSGVWSLELRRLHVSRSRLFEVEEQQLQRSRDEIDDEPENHAKWMS